MITLCFVMHASYKPPMITFAIQRNKYSCGLFRRAKECVLGVPGERIADQTLLCGVESGRDVDKVSACGFILVPSLKVRVSGISQCIANLEISVTSTVESGDHLIVVGQVRRYGVDVNASGEVCSVNRPSFCRL